MQIRMTVLAATFCAFSLFSSNSVPEQHEDDLKAPKPIAAVPVQVFNKGTGLHVRAMAFSANGKTLYIAGTMGKEDGRRQVDGRLGAWDMASGKFVREHQGPRMGYFWSGLFDDKYLLGWTESERHLILIDPVTGEEVRRTDSNAGRFDRYFALPDRKRVLAVHGDVPSHTGTEPVQAWEWDLVTGKRGAEIPLDLSGGFRDAEVVCSPDGAWFAQSDTEFGTRVFDARSGKKVLHNPVGFQGIFSSDARTFAYVVGRERHVRLHRTDTWDTLAEIPWPEDSPDAPGSSGIHALCFTADGRALVIAYGDSRIAVVEVATGQIRYRFEHHTFSLRIFPENPLLVTVAQTGSAVPQGAPFLPIGWVALWNLHNPTGRQAAELTRAEAARCLKQFDDVRAAVASEGMRALAANPNQAVGLLWQTLRAVPKPDPVQVARWIADLDDDDFDTREKAEQQLREHDAAIRSLLEAARDRPRSPDSARRLRALLAEMTDPARPARLRTLRSVELLEYFATAEARAVLEALAAGAPGAVPTEEAKASLRRLHRRIP